MTVTAFKQGVLLQETEDFHVGQTLECGQFFRYVKKEENAYVIIAYNTVLHLEQKGADIYLYPTTLDAFEEIWMDFFDLRRDYSRLKKQLSKDAVLAEAIQENPGIRILRQDPWECMVAFQISQNSNIPRIRQVIENIACQYGEEAGGGFYTFPSAKQLAAAGVEGLRSCKTGFRDKYIFDGAEKVTKAKLDLKALASMPTAAVKEALMKVKGIGPKVSDCILLFSYSRGEVFPTDVWIKRAVENLYFQGKKLPAGQIQDFAAARFGDYAGFAQQYLFHYYRNGKEIILDCV